jgi:predicted aldo/keto reductase-like oxidoreductase
MSESTHPSVSNRFSRRGFLSQALTGVAAGTAFSSVGKAVPVLTKHRATDVVTLGKTGIKTSFLAQGTGFNGGGRSSAHTRLGEKEFEKLVRHGMDQGIRLMDAADLYGSHRYIQHTLKGVPRDHYSLLSKIWPREEYWNMASGGATEEVNRFRKELDSEVIDICLIHCMTSPNWPQQYERIRDELSEMKQQGAVRAVGVSCHNFEALKVAATHPWVDVILARINNKGASMDASVEEVTPVLKQARADGKVVIGMKLFGAGKLVQPDQKDASLKYVFENQLVDAVTVGMLSTEQVDDTVMRIDKALKA